ncbi:MAG: ribonuclease Z [Nanoarchaeota archaeon]|nr:ribonuclease Z [Nanoarchaeota archaeon]
MEIIFLGTSGMQPTKERNLFSVLFRYNSEGILIDCGEGTQRQMRMMKLSTTKIKKILITHLHGDHVNGLPGFLQNLYWNQYTKELEIYGPKGLKKLMFHILSIAGVKLKIKIVEIKEGVFYKSKDFNLECKELSHSCLCYGYNFIENDRRRMNLTYLKKYGLNKHPLLGELQKGKDIIHNGKKINVKNATKIIRGKKITLIADTKYCENAVKLAKNADLLISESTYLSKLQDEASKYKHLTSKDAATIAKKAKVKKLVLTHFSQRYKDLKEIEKEAKKVFKNTIVAKDFMKVEV